jgi:hypothetical protein
MDFSQWFQIATSVAMGFVMRDFFHCFVRALTNQKEDE